MTWECVECCNVFDGPRKPARCSECGSRRLIASDPDDRQPDEDDGRTYSDPRDARDERRGL